MPAALLLVAGGTLACFAGYRLLRLVLAIYGFILGAMIASSVMGVSNATGMIVAAVLGGFVGALVLVLAYFAGVALVGAGLGALLVHLAWKQYQAGDPPAWLVIALAAAGAVGAMVLRRYVIVFATAFGGAWTMILGGLALAGDPKAPRLASASDVWILYPTSAVAGNRWALAAWLALGAIGTMVQLRVTARKRR
jgi:hypothetical protein